MTALDVITWVLLAAATGLNLAIWIRQRRRNQAIAARPTCSGHRYGEPIRIIGDTPESAMRLTITDRPADDPPSDDKVILKVKWPPLDGDTP